MKYQLTAKQIKELDEITLNKRAQELTLRVALNYHANMLATIEQKRKMWWKELGEIHNLDLENIQYKVETFSACIVEDNQEKGGDEE